MQLPKEAFSGPVAIGLSGGADSLALLLKVLTQGISCVALHFNHGFEDEAGDEDEAFVRDFCSQRNIELVVGRCIEPWTSGETKEVFARRHRMDFFKREMHRRNLSLLFLAHHADDRAENAVLRLARGCGPEGLTSFSFAAPFPGEPAFQIYRPLLDETHIDQVAWLQTHGESWREDLSNADTSIPRNAIRHLLVPRLPHFSAGVNAAVDLLTEEHLFLESLAAEATVHQTPHELKIRANTHLVLVRRLLRAWLGPLTKRQTEELVALSVGALCEVAGATRVRRQSETTWTRDAKSLDAPELIQITAPGTCTFGPWQITVKDDGETEKTAIRLPLPLTVRSRLPGDKIRPGGFTGSRKVQNVLVDLKIPAHERPAYPIFCDETGQVVYIPGLRPARFPDALPRYTVTVTRTVN